jgi:hypothetical protein
MLWLLFNKRPVQEGIREVREVVEREGWDWRREEEVIWDNS